MENKFRNISNIVVFIVIAIFFATTVYSVFRVEIQESAPTGVVGLVMAGFEKIYLTLANFKTIIVEKTELADSEISVNLFFLAKILCVLLMALILYKNKELLIDIVYKVKQKSTKGEVAKTEKKRTPSPTNTAQIGLILLMLVGAVVVLSIYSEKISTYSLMPLDVLENAQDKLTEWKITLQQKGNSRTTPLLSDPSFGGAFEYALIKLQRSIFGSAEEVSVLLVNAEFQEQAKGIFDEINSGLKKVGQYSTLRELPSGCKGYRFYEQNIYAPGDVIVCSKKNYFVAVIGTSKAKEVASIIYANIK